MLLQLILQLLKVLKVEKKNNLKEVMMLLKLNLKVKQSLLMLLWLKLTQEQLTLTTKSSRVLKALQNFISELHLSVNSSEIPSNKESLPLNSQVRPILTNYLPELPDSCHLDSIPLLEKMPMPGSLD
jgi:hypothetical protein